MTCRAVLCWGGVVCALVWASPARAQTSLDPALQVETYVSGLSRPVAIAWLAPNDMLVVERELGRVRRILNGVVQPTVALQIPSGGTDDFLQGIAINSEAPPLVFIHVEDQTGIAGNHIDRYEWNPATEKLENGQTIIQISAAGSPANADDGGKMLLGPADPLFATPTAGDGQLLYVVAGYLEKDGQLRNEPAGVPPDNAGVILRVDQAGGPAPGNPFTPYCSTTTATQCSDDGDCPGGETCETQVALYYAYGIRNSLGIALDPVTGDLWDEENGEDEYDELNRVEAGMNSGWTPIMGPAPMTLPTLFEMPGGGWMYSDPEYSWVDTTGPTGVAFPYGSTLGLAYDNTLWFADFNENQIYSMPLNASRDAFDLADIVAETQAELDAFAVVTGFPAQPVATEFGPDGSLYVVTYFGGTIYRITGPRDLTIPALADEWLGLLALALLSAGIRSIRRPEARFHPYG